MLAVIELGSFQPFSEVHVSFLDQFEQGIEAGRGHHVCFIDDVDLEAAADGGEKSPLPEIASVVDAAVTGRVDLDDVDASWAIACQIPTRLTLATGHGTRTLFTVERAGENPC